MDDKLHFLLVLLACEQCNLHDQPNNYLAAYPSWIEHTYSLENIIWRFRYKAKEATIRTR